MPKHFFDSVESELSCAERLCNRICARTYEDGSVAASRWELDKLFAALRDGVRDEPAIPRR